MIKCLISKEHVVKTFFFKKSLPGILNLLIYLFVSLVKLQIGSNEPKKEAVAMRREATLGSDLLQTACMLPKLFTGTSSCAFSLGDCDSLHLNYKNSNLIDLHLNKPSAAERQDLSSLCGCGWMGAELKVENLTARCQTGGSKSIIHCRGLMGGLSQIKADRSWRKTAYATHAWIAMHSFFFF